MAGRTQILEAVARRESECTLSVSLRGTLAARYDALLRNGTSIDRQTFIRALLTSPDPDLIFETKKGVMVIGRLSEKGQFFPDW